MGLAKTKFWTKKTKKLRSIVEANISPPLDTCHCHCQTPLKWVMIHSHSHFFYTFIGYLYPSSLSIRSFMTHFILFLFSSISFMTLHSHIFESVCKENLIPPESHCRTPSSMSLPLALSATNIIGQKSWPSWQIKRKILWELSFESVQVGLTKKKGPYVKNFP